MRRPLLLCLLLLPGVGRADGDPGGAFPPPASAMAACPPASEGMAACLAGKRCLCRFERGGSLAGRPDRFAWDCGPLRPACGPAPADLPPPWPDPPEPRWRDR